MENVEYASAESGKRGVWKTRSVENAECGECKKKIHAVKNFKKRDRCAYKLLRINDFNKLYFPLDLIEWENIQKKKIKMYIHV